MKKKNLKQLVNALEQIQENEKGQLQGGFSGIGSPVITLAAERNRKCQVTNNCQGGNCVIGCSLG